MTEITLKLKDEIIKEYLSFLHTMGRVEEQIKASEMDYDKALEAVREEAWQESKKDFIN